MCDFFFFCSRKSRSPTSRSPSHSPVRRATAGGVPTNGYDDPARLLPRRSRSGYNHLGGSDDYADPDDIAAHPPVNGGGSSAYRQQAAAERAERAAAREREEEKRKMQVGG